MNKKIHTMVLSALLIAVGILIPMISPIKIMIEPMSFTLASHVAILVAIFVSPSVAVSVALGSTLGFLLAGFPLPVVLRALSHVVWAFAGAYYLKKNPDTLNSALKTGMLMLGIGVLHAIAEVVIVVPIYIGTMEIQSFIYTIFGLVGVGTLVHSCVDFVLAVAVWKVICKSNSVSSISNVKEVSLRLSPKAI
ncbi:MAG: hypothetical protein RSA93_06695 [Longicatena sp.]